MTTKTKTPKSPKAPILSGREALAALKGKKSPAKAVAEAQAKDAAANAHAVKPDAKTGKPKKVPAVKEPKAKKISGLDAAATVLAAAKEPMTCKAIVDEMLAKGMWKTNGKTPHATIYSAMLREIDAKPGESRFAKTGRGLFARAKAKA